MLQILKLGHTANAGEKFIKITIWSYITALATKVQTPKFKFYSESLKPKIFKAFENQKCAGIRNNLIYRFNQNKPSGV